MKRYFHEELIDLKSKLILLGEQSYNITKLAIEGFLDNDMHKINSAYNMDDDLDDLEMEISHLCLRYLSLRSPVSSDLKLLIVALKASKDFERIGDEAHNITKKSYGLLTKESPLKNKINIKEMGELVSQLVKDTIDCFVDEDIDKAFAVLKNDREINSLDQKNYKFLSSEESRDEFSDLSRFNLLLISKSLERIGDHSKNIAKGVIFLLSSKQ